MLWVLAALATPLPSLHDATSPWTGSPDLTVGTAFWQVPMRGAGWAHPFPRVNVNATLAGQLGRRGVLGLHGGWQYTRYGPEAVRANPNGRIEPRVGVRYRLGPGLLDLTAGLSVDRGRGVFMLGPVLAVAPRFPLGRTRTYLVLEGRLGLRFSARETSMLCYEWCDQVTIDNPGGTGVLVGLGRALRTRVSAPASSSPDAG